MSTDNRRPRKSSRLPERPLASPGDRRRPNNRKLGHLIWSWSIPALLTCPGKSLACIRDCYALGFMFRMMADRLAFLLSWSRSPRFVADVTSQIRRDDIHWVRVHVAGDFYSAAYLIRWLTIAERNPRTTFFFYTRSWRRADGTPNAKMLRLFARAAKMTNVHAWFSEDRDTGPAPKVPGVRVAWTAFLEADLAATPAHADLVFRDGRMVKRGGPLKRVAGILVCPAEQGVPRQTPLTCSLCRICCSPPRPLG